MKALIKTPDSSCCFKDKRVYKTVDLCRLKEMKSTEEDSIVLPLVMPFKVPLKVVALQVYS